MGKVKAMAAEYGNSRLLRFRVIRPVFHTEVIREDLPAYIATDRYTSPLQIYEMFRDLRIESRENFIALHLDGKNRINAIDRISTGSLSQSIVHPREVFKTALISSAAALILIHNHPSGDTQPSSEDITITKRLKECGDLLGINVLDHIIVGDGSYTSFVERGLL